MRVWTSQAWRSARFALVWSAAGLMALWWSGSLGAVGLGCGSAGAQSHCAGRPQSCAVSTRDDAGCCPRARARTGQLTLRASGPGGAALPSGARVSVDGGQGRPLPLERVQLSVGQHRLVVTVPGYETYEEVVELGARGERLSIRMTRVAAPVTPAPVVTPPAPVVTPPAPVATGVCPTGMAGVPGGTFWMGSTDGDADEAPVHQVTVSTYCLDRTEVTVSAYGECVSAGGCTPAPTTVSWSGITAADRDLFSQFCNGSRGDRAQHPVNCVDWEMASGYCRWRGRRLPTEAEWEYAARGTSGRQYPWDGEGLNGRQLNACGMECRALGARLGQSWPVMYETDDGWGATSPVGSYPAGASPFGMLDMAGNVWEWTSDWYGAYGQGAVRDPSGPSSGAERVLRGGSWSALSAARVRSAFRDRNSPSYRSDGVGFRCARGA
jgi:sulfatase modifying factor 1